MLFESIVFTLLFSLCFADIDGKLNLVCHRIYFLSCIETLLFCKTPPPKLINGLIKRDRVSYYNGKGYVGNMEYMCLPGFSLIGNKIVTCQNGIWSTMTQCICIF
jgi:hypothetical protein